MIHDFAVFLCHVPKTCCLGYERLLLRHQELLLLWLLLELKHLLLAHPLLLLLLLLHLLRLELLLHLPLLLLAHILGLPTHPRMRPRHHTPTKPNTHAPASPPVAPAAGMG